MKKLISLILIITLSLMLVGCSKSTSNNVQAMTNIDQTLTKITSTIKKLDSISNDKLIMQDFMNTSSLVDNRKSNLDIYRYYNPYQNQDNNGYNGATFTNTSPMSTYINKLHHLSNIATITISANNQLNYLKDNIISNSSYIKTSCNQIKEKGCEVSNGQKNAINDLCNNLIVNLNRINLTKNEITNEINSLTALKSNYTNNIDQLNSKYTRLLNCIETRTLYYKNILTSMNGVDTILNEICCPKNDFCYGTDYENNSNSTNNKETQKNIIKSNIDTYENANSKNTNKNYNNQPYNQYSQNQYYYNNFQRLPYRNFNGFNYGYPHSPYSNYNPYMPNVDTFINYNNIDSYKSNKQLEKEQKETNENIEQTENEKQENIVQTSKTKPNTKKYYTIAEDDYLKYKEYVKNIEKSTK